MGEGWVLSEPFGGHKARRRQGLRRVLFKAAAGATRWLWQCIAKVLRRAGLKSRIGLLDARYFQLRPRSRRRRRGQNRCRGRCGFLPLRCPAASRPDGAFEGRRRHVCLQLRGTNLGELRHSVHANPKGALFKLGLMGNAQLLPVGPTNFGFTDPGHSTAISLGQATAAFLLQTPTPERLLTVQVMTELGRDVGAAFLRVQQRMERG